MKRQFSVDLIVESSQNLKRQEHEIINSSSHQNVKTSTKKIVAAAVTDNTPLPDIIYKQVECKWINKIYTAVKERDYSEKLNLMLLSEKSDPVKRISIYYHCLLDCIITISEMKRVSWDDLADLTNTFTFVINSADFNELPCDYPFTKSLTSIRDKLKSFCLETQQEEEIQFRLKFETKINLFLERFELSLQFPKITYSELKLNLENLK